MDPAEASDSGLLGLEGIAEPCCYPAGWEASMTWPAGGAREGAGPGLLPAADVSKEDRSLNKRRLGVPGRKLASFRTPTVAAWSKAALTCIEPNALLTYDRDYHELSCYFQGCHQSDS